jgi:hypothetical protein
MYWWLYVVCTAGCMAYVQHTSVPYCYDLNEFNSGCNERQRLEGEKGIINELVKRKEYRSITTLLIRLGLPRVTINGVGLSNYDRGV